MRDKIRSLFNPLKFGVNAFIHLTFGITDRYKICIGIEKLLYKEQKIGLFT